MPRHTIHTRPPFECIAFLCADLGITPETREDHAAYAGSWLKVLKNDKKAIFTAASHAQKAIDHLYSYQSQEAPS